MGFLAPSYRVPFPGESKEAPSSSTTMRSSLLQDLLTWPSRTKISLLKESTNSITDRGHAGELSASIYHACFSVGKLQTHAGTRSIWHLVYRCWEKQFQPITYWDFFSLRKNERTRELRILGLPISSSLVRAKGSLLAILTTGSSESWDLDCCVKTDGSGTRPTSVNSQYITYRIFTVHNQPIFTFWKYEVKPW